MRRSGNWDNRVSIPLVALLGTLALGLGAFLLRQGGFEPPAVETASRTPDPAHQSPADPEPPATAPEGLDATTRFAADPGDQFAYELVARWEARLQHHVNDGTAGVQWKMQGELPSRVETDLKGTLRVTVLAHEDGAYLVRFFVAEPRLHLRTGAHGRAIDSLALDRGAVVRLAEDGRVLGYSFDPDVRSETRSLLIAVFSLSHQFMLRDSPDPWTVTGLHDDVGTFTGRFEWRAAARSAGADTVLRRTVVAYDPQAGQKIERSASEATFASGWVASADVREERRASIADVLSAETTVHLRLGLAQRTTGPVDPAHIPPASAGWLLHAPATVSSAGTDSQELEEQESAVGDPIERLDAILAELDALIEESRLDGHEAFEAWRNIADLVRRSPDAVLPELLAMIRGRQLDPAAVNWAVSAIGKAGDEGSAPAVAALVGLIADATVGDETRLAALISAHQLGTRVPPELVEAVTGVLLGTGGGEDPLPSAAALLVGTLAGRDTLAPQDRDITETALDVVQEIAFARGEPEVYFDALLNSERREYMERALDYVGHAEETVRRAAIDALRGLRGDPRAIEAVVDRLAEEPSPLVRGTAVDSLAALEPTPDGAPVLLELSLHDPDQGVRARAVAALGDHAAKGLADAHDALVRASVEGSAEIRELARSVIDDLAEPANDATPPQPGDFRG